MRQRQTEAGYREVNTPDILDKTLWEKSGHWEKFQEHMYTTKTPDERVFAIKPMNCPGCVQIFNQGLKSYRDTFKIIRIWQSSSLRKLRIFTWINES